MLTALFVLLINDFCTVDGQGWLLVKHQLFNSLTGTGMSNSISHGWVSYWKNPISILAHWVLVVLILLLLLLLWHAPLGLCSIKCRHQFPEWTILSHSYRLIQGEIVGFEVLLDSLHSRRTRTSWWSPPVLRRGSSYDTPGICLVWHSRSVAEQRKMPCLDNSRQAGLPGCPSHLVIPHVMVPFDS